VFANPGQDVVEQLLTNAVYRFGQLSKLRLGKRYYLIGIGNEKIAGPIRLNKSWHEVQIVRLLGNFVGARLKVPTCAR
jgi:hypothetical protein